MTLKKLLSTVLLALGTSLASVAHASLLTGDTVNLKHYFPDLLSINADLGSQVVPTGNFNYFDIYNVVVYGDYMTVDVFCGPGCYWSPSSFNGPVLTDLSNAPFTGVEIDPSTNYAGFDASRLSFDADHVYINLQNLDANGFLRINFAVPEPGTLALLGLGLAGLAATCRRKK